jgi:hypothetical protein
MLGLINFSLLFFFLSKLRRDFRTLNIENGDGFHDGRSKTKITAQIIHTTYKQWVKPLLMLCLL